MADAPWDHIEHVAACELLERFGAEVTRLHRPSFFVLRWAGPRQAPHVEPVPGAAGLLGVSVGEPWDAVAVVASGRFRSLDQRSEPPAEVRSGLGGGLQIACVVSRSGVVGWRLVLPDGSTYAPVPEEGFMLDVLHRALGLATTPPPAGPARLLLYLWVTEIVTLGRFYPARFDWSATLALNPTAEADPLLPVEEAEREVLLSNATTRWDVLRRLAAMATPESTTPEATTEESHLPPPALCDWMDEGMFARWVLDRLPSTSDITAAARPHLTPAAWRRFHHLAHRMEQPLEQAGPSA